MPKTPTAEERQKFLDFIREGDDRSTAAWRVNPKYSGTLFRSMCNPISQAHYDAEFARAYDAAVAQRGPLNPHRNKRERDGSPTNSNGFTKASHLTEYQLEQFLEKVAEGEPMDTAAREIDPPTSMTQIARRADKDPEFANAFRAAREEGYPAFKESLRGESVRQAFAGDYRALRDLMVMHLEEAKALVTSRHEIGGYDGGAIRMLVEERFHELPRPMLDELIRMLEAKERQEQKALPAPQ